MTVPTIKYRSFSTDRDVCKDQLLQETMKGKEVSHIFTNYLKTSTSLSTKLSCLQFTVADLRGGGGGVRGLLA